MVNEGLVPVLRLQRDKRLLAVDMDKWMNEIGASKIC